MILKEISDHLLIISLLIGTIFTGCWLSKYRQILKVNLLQIVVISILHTIFGVISVTAFAFIESGFDVDSIGNMSLFGGVFLMPIFYFVLSKIIRVDAKIIFDYCTNCMLFTLMCARVNCIISGCCKGNYIFHTGYRWPTREIEIIFYIILIIMVTKKMKSGRIQGEIYPIYMMSYGTFRFAIEGFRVYDGEYIIHMAHIWALLSLCLGFSIYAEMQKEYKRRREKTK